MCFPKWPRWVWRCYAAAFAAVGAFLVCSFVPIWEVRPGGVFWWDVDNSSLWEAMEQSRPQHLSNWEQPAVITAVAVHIAAIVGAILGGVRWRKNEEQPQRGDSQ